MTGDAILHRIDLSESVAFIHLDLFCEHMLRSYIRYHVDVPW